jgi:hypothetical protein
MRARRRSLNPCAPTGGGVWRGWQRDGRRRRACCRDSVGLLPGLCQGSARIRPGPLLPCTGGRLGAAGGCRGGDPPQVRAMVAGAAAGARSCRPARQRPAARHCPPGDRPSAAARLPSRSGRRVGRREAPAVLDLRCSAPLGRAFRSPRRTLPAGWWRSFAPRPAPAAGRRSCRIARRTAPSGTQRRTALALRAALGRRLRRTSRVATPRRGTAPAARTASVGWRRRLG